MHGHRKQNKFGWILPQKKYYWVSIYTNSTHQYVVVNITKDDCQLLACVVQMVKRVQ